MTTPTARQVTARRPARAAEAMIVGVCCLTTFMIAVDTTVANLALPLIGRGLHAPLAGLQWTIAAYSIATASLMLTSGSVGDRFGRRTVLQAGLAVFALGSFGCSVAPDAGWLIACRALQGAGGSALTPMSVGVITATFSDPAARARAIGIWTGTIGVGMVAGPVIGGALAAAWGWRSLFWVTILPAVVGIIAAGLVIPDSRADRLRRLDPPGQVLVIAFLACLVYGIIEGPSAGWRSPPILSVFAASAAALGGFAAWERRRAEPLIDLRVFRSLPFSGALVITVCAFTSLGGFLFLTTLYLQDVHRLSVLQAGLALAPLAAATAVAGPMAGRVMGRHGARGPLAFAGVTLTVSCLMLARVPAPGSWTLLSTGYIAVAYIVFGAGYGAVNTVISAVAVAGMPRSQAGVAGGVTSAGRQAGHSLGPAVTGAILAAGLHGPLQAGFSAASHPAWLVIAACGLMVLLLGLVTTSRRALRTAALVDALRGVRAGELRADLVRTGMLDVVKDGSSPSRRRARGWPACCGQAGRGRDGDVRAGVQAQQPEHPRRVRAELVIRPREHRADPGSPASSASSRPDVSRSSAARVRPGPKSRRPRVGCMNSPSSSAVITSGPENHVTITAATFSAPRHRGNSVRRNHEDVRLSGLPGVHTGWTGPSTCAIAERSPQLIRAWSEACCPHQLPQCTAAAARRPGCRIT